jgi:hypothetical protein
MVKEKREGTKNLLLSFIYYSSRTTHKMGISDGDDFFSFSSLFLWILYTLCFAFIEDAIHKNLQISSYNERDSYTHSDASSHHQLNVNVDDGRRRRRFSKDERRWEAMKRRVQQAKSRKQDEKK